MESVVKPEPESCPPDVSTFEYGTALLAAAPVR
jgi:hypothetical protein